MNENERHYETREGLLGYDVLLRAAEAIMHTTVVICPDQRCKKTATVEGQPDGSTVTRLHAEGRHDPVTTLVKHLDRAADYESPRPVRIKSCPAHIDYFARVLEQKGIVIGPEDSRTPEEIYYSLVRFGPAE